MQTRSTVGDDNHPFPTPARCKPVTFLLASIFLVAAVAAGVSVAQAAPLVVQLLGADGQPVTGAVVGALVRGAHATTSTASAQVAQKERQFQPVVTAIQTGTAVHFPNLDTVRHHVFSFSPIKRFELKLYAGTPAAPVVFDKAGVAVLGCNIHDRMAAWVVVMDTPLLTRSDAAGQVSFDLPAGEHRLQAWRPGWPENEPFAELGVTQTAGGQRLSWTLAPRAR